MPFWSTSPKPPKPPREPALARAARALFEPWTLLPPEKLEASRIDLELAGAAMGRVFDATGNPDQSAQRLIRLAMLVAAERLKGGSLEDAYKKARTGIPPAWWPFLDRLFGVPA